MTSQRRIFKHRSGMTLQELLVSMAIVGFLTVIVFSTFSKSKDIGALKSVSRKLVIDLQGAQISAQGGVLFNGNTTYGYGVYLQSATSSYTIFADAVTSQNQVYNAGTDYLIKTVSLPTGSTGITVEKLLAGTDTVNRSPAHIFFRSPNGTGQMYFTGATPVNPVAIGKIRLRSTKLAVCYDVEITTNVGTVRENRKPPACP